MNQSITTLKGIGEKTEKIFHKAGIETIDDLLHYYPRSYVKFQAPVPIANLEAGKIQAVCGMLTKDATVKRVRNLQIINAVIRDETGILQLTWFNMPYMRSTLKAGSRFVFRGKAVKHQAGLAMEQPIIYRLNHYEEQMDTLRPIYPLVNGLTNKLVTGAVKQALEKYPMQKEYLPEPVRKEYRLAEYNFAVQNIHFPKSEEDLLYARRRLVFDEFLVFILTVRRMKDQQDGVRNGYDLQQLAKVRAVCHVPLIASGGAGTMEHFLEAFRDADVDGALAASVFHKQIINIGELKAYLAAQGVEIRVC